MRAACVFAAIAVIAVALVSGAVIPLPAYNANIKSTTVSGLSSGGFFAVQMHVTYSSFIRGAAVFAGGPYDCAQGELVTAITQCMNALPAPDPSTSLATTKQRSSSGLIDSYTNLASSWVYLYSGTEDATVKPPVMHSLYKYYTDLIPASQVIFVSNVTSAHTQPTDDPINTEPCTTSQSPFISDCQYDGAGIGLQQVYQPAELSPRNNGPLNGTVINFDQTAFCPSQTCAPIGLADSGYAYIPTACALGAPCMLHVSFHGCEQNFDSVGLDYVQNAGYNKWADTNQMIVLYPQTIASFENPSNPNGCWDWWGIVAPGYDTNSGAQQLVIRAMIKKVTGH